MTTMILLPLLGTTFGAAMVFFMKKEITPWVEKLMLGFASGVMLAAAVWSLLLPSIAMAEQKGRFSFVPATVGFLLGILFLMLLDLLLPHMRKHRMLFAITLHNLPEGMAVGIGGAGVLASTSGISLSMAMALSLGIAIQNIPEGMIVSMPLCGAGKSKVKAFIYGTASGIVEPLGALAALFFARQWQPVMPYLLAFAAGAMLYVVIEELIPEVHQGSYRILGTVGFALGFVLMMVLDVSLG